jgi:hypothetical protein
VMIKIARLTARRSPRRRQNFGHPDDHCAILTDRELAELRRIVGVIHLGRVIAIDVNEMSAGAGNDLDWACHVAPRLLSVRYTHVPLEGRLRGRSDHAPMGALMPTGLQGCPDWFRRIHVRPVVPPTVPLDSLRMYRVE